MKHNEFKLINGALANCFECVLKENELIDFKKDYTFYEFEDKYNILFGVKEIDFDIENLYSLNLQALNKYINYCERANPKSEFMKMEIRNGLSVAMKMKKEICEI